MNLTAIKIKEGRIIAKKLVTIKARLVKTNSVAVMFCGALLTQRSLTWVVFISQKREMTQSSWPWLGSRAPTWSLEQAWIDCHWRFENMMSVFLLLLLPCVDRADCSGGDDATNAAQGVFHHKNCFSWSLWHHLQSFFPWLQEDTQDWHTHTQSCFC